MRLCLIQLAEQRRIICADLPGLFSGPHQKDVRSLVTIPDSTDVALKAVAYFRTLQSGTPPRATKMTRQEWADQREFVVSAVSAVAPEELGRAALRLREETSGSLVSESPTVQAVVIRALLDLVGACRSIKRVDGCAFIPRVAALRSTPYHAKGSSAQPKEVALLRLRGGELPHPKTLRHKNSISWPK